MGYGSQMGAVTRSNALVRMTTVIALVFGACAFAAVLFSVFVMASRPWGCSVTSDSPVVTCDWVTSRVVAAAWLVVALGVCLISWKRWKFLLAIISVPLFAVSMISVVGVFSMAPAAFWFGCALWLWAQGRLTSIVVSALTSFVLLYFAAEGVRALIALHATPI